MSDQQDADKGSAAPRERPAYYAVIPAKVRYDKRLPPNAKLLYGEITALCGKEGYCWASNAYFANLYDVDRSSVTKWLRALTASGYIRTEFVYARGKPNIESRRIYLAEAVPVPEAPAKNGAGENENNAGEGGGEIIHQGGGEIFHQGGEKSQERILHLNITDLNSAAASSAGPEKTEKSEISAPPETAPPEKTAAAEPSFSEMKEDLKRLDCRLVLDPPFYGKARRFLDQNGFDSGYLSFLLEFCERKKPGRLAGYFYRIFFEPRFAELYRDALEKKSKPPPEEREVSCPACGTAHKRNLPCPACGLPPEHFNDPESAEYHKRLFEMGEKERETYRAETEEVSLSEAGFEEKAKRLRAIKAKYRMP